ncbi:MAG: zinc ribbon domain-containing protein [Thermoplasmata archaeon]|nr:zinc ribbon domain-containing protein [Thermoplasmata archaeon]
MTDLALTVDLLIVIAILVAVFLFFNFFIIRRTRLRRRQLSGEISDAKEVVEDRAHNQIRIALQEASILERDGVDVSRPRRLLDDAGAAYRRQDYHHSLQLGRTAHDVLVSLRQQSRSSAAPTPSGSSTVRPESLAALALGAPDPLGNGLAEDSESVVAIPPEAPRPAIPKNRMESHFQLSLLRDELEIAQRDRPAAAAVVEASRLATEAHSAEGQEEYTEALRIALKARRTLGGKIETLPPPRAAPSASRATTVGGTEALRSTPILESPEVCPKCGRPTRREDAFCRSCGAPRAPAKCPRCGGPLEANDQFCGRCGSPVS